MNKQSELTRLVENLKMDPKNTSLFSLIGNEIKQYSLHDKWVFTVLLKGSNSLALHEVNGKQFVPIFSDEQYIKAKGEDVLLTSINKIISALLSNPKLCGIEINPFSIGLCIETGTLIQYIFGEYERYELEKRIGEKEYQNILLQIY